MRLALSALSMVAMLGGCAYEPPPRPQPTTSNRVGGAIATPLHDVNLVRTKIPDILLDSVDAPYARPRPLSCPEIAAEIAPLDEALGPDLDHPINPGDVGLLQRGETVAGDAAIGALRDAAGNLIPMRSWVRLLSGAQRHDKLVAAAITAGGLRRAYLKGLGLAKRCNAPARPLEQAQDAVPGAQRLRKAADAALSR
jgi:hypothetical protein